MSDFALKDYIDADVVERLGTAFQTVWPAFPLNTFVEKAVAPLEDLTFTQRTTHIASMLRQALPDAYPEALHHLVSMLPDPLEGFDGVLNERFWLWPLGDFIRDHGADHIQESLEACYHLTKCFTAEFAVRPLLKKDPAYCLSRLAEWTSDPNEHVRRFISEGTRPRLPWSSRLDLPLDRVLPLLESLQDDPSDYVRRSVANHLNDLGKADTDWLPGYLGNWMDGAGEERMHIIKHALRNHVKQGNPGALKLLGYDKFEPAKFQFEASSVVTLGDYLKLSCAFKNESDNPQALIVDFAIHFRKANGELSRKVFKWKTFEAAAGEEVQLNKRMQLAQRNTRRLYPGLHLVDVQVNGRIIEEREFNLFD